VVCSANAPIGHAVHTQDKLRVNIVFSLALRPKALSVFADYVKGITYRIRNWTEWTTAWT